MPESIYLQKNAPIFEAIYGKGFISLGGAQAVHRLFDSVNIKNKLVLDIGCGLGGMLQLLASKYGARGVGLDIHPWMSQYVSEASPALIKERLRFLSYVPGEAFPIEDESIDLATSKGVFTNIKDKRAVFSEIKRVLKPAGELLFVDWLVKDSVGQEVTVLDHGEPSFKESKSSYLALLNDLGFNEISFENASKEYLGYIVQLDKLYKSKDHRQAYLTIIDDKLRHMLIQANEKLLESVKREMVYSYKIRASK